MACRFLLTSANNLSKLEHNEYQLVLLQVGTCGNLLILGQDHRLYIHGFLAAITKSELETMKKIAILGTGCPKCDKLAANTKLAAEELNLECEIVKVTEVAEIMKYGVMLTPALVVDGEVKAVGNVPGLEEIKTIIG